LSPSRTRPAWSSPARLTNYAATDAHRIKGLRSEQIAELLGPQNYDALVHRDNLVVTAGSRG
jgi:glutamate 5-kinase